DPSLSNGVIVSRIARTADPAGTQEQTGNGRVNLARALSDTNTDEVEPAGTTPFGDGGPFIGPYRAAACTLNTGSNVSVVSQSPVLAAPGDTVSYVNITLTKGSNGNCTGNWTVNWVGGPAPAGTSASFSPLNFAGSGTTKTTTLTITTTAATP